MPDYFEVDALNNSFLKIVRDCPAKAKYQMDHGQPQPTDAMLFGSYVHACLLEPDTVDSRYVVAPEINKRTKAGKEEWAEFLSANEGKGIVTDSDMRKVEDMRQSLLSNNCAVEKLTACEKEVETFWTDAESGNKCKAKIDGLADDFAVDLKTTADASPRGFSRAIVNYSYHMQAAFYIDGAQRKDFYFIAMEKTPPYVTMVYQVAWGTLQLGKRRYREAIETYDACVKSGIWPGYANGILKISAPEWAFSDEVEEEGDVGY